MSYTLPAQFVFAALLTLAALVVTIPPGRAQSEISIATHPDGSAYHKIGTSISEILSQSYGQAGVVKPFKRWTAYLPRIDAGEIDIGFVTGIDAGTRFRAKSDRALPNLRAVARLWALRYTYIGRAALSMKNYVGLRGRRIGLVVRNNPTMNSP